MQADSRAVSLIKYYDKLKSDRHTWDAHWREVAEYILPNKDAVTGKKADGEKKHQEIVDTTAIHSNELLASALHGMLTNPTVPWFGLSTGKTELDEQDEVRKWLQDTVRIMHNVLNNSNFQTEIHEVYLDLGSFGTGALHIDEDDTDFIRFLSIPIYEIYIDENYKGAVSAIARCFKKPMKDIIDEFGIDEIKKAGLDRELKDLHKEHEILHIIGENTEYNPYKMDVKSAKYYSVYILKDKKLILREKSYNTFPLVVPRWTKISGEKYGRSPGMKALPDAKMINQMMRVTIRGAQKIVDPPLQAPDDGAMGPIRTIPGAINYYRAGTQDRIEPLITGARADIGFDMMEDVRTRIRSAFFIDQLQLREGPQMTATEVQQRTEEQLRLLGPILGRQHNELLKPLVDRLFEICLKRNLLPKIPASLAGKKVDVQYSSMIARAQKTAELETVNRFFMLAAPVLQIDPGVMDNIDSDMLVRRTASTLSLPYEFMRNKLDVKKLREGRAEQQAQMQAQIQEQHEADVAAKVGPVVAGNNGQQKAQ